MSRKWVPLLGLVAVASCAASLSSLPTPYDFFAKPVAEDVWSLRIRDWQAARRFDVSTDAHLLPPLSPLAEEYELFTQRLRRRLVEDTVRWVQTYSELYYRADTGPDAWPTLAEVKVFGGDDCDGLDLLTFELLRRLGFASGEIYRSVLRDPAGRNYHMVTLWFPEPQRDDPYVLDSTGEVSKEVVRLSTVSGWIPVAIFDEVSQFRVSALDG